MLERELRRFKMFAQLGGVGIEPGSTGSIKRLVRFLRDVRTGEAGTCVSFFPQGRIGSAAQRPLGFQ
ncbi:MAG: glycerol acyltransferase, partial [Actinobacteria bacterium]|nr:glycerol acyltransferase [Actinomycetota bacterium]